MCNETSLAVDHYECLGGIKGSQESGQPGQASITADRNQYVEVRNWRKHVTRRIPNIFII